MKRLLLIAILPLLCAWPSVNIGGGVPVAGGNVFNDCGDYDGAAMLYCQDMETTGGGNPSGESPAMDSSFGPDCDYATSPAPLDGSQSCYRNASGRIWDTSSHTAITGQGWWQFLLHVPATPTDGNRVFRAKVSTSDTFPNLQFANVSGSNYDLQLFCDGTFGGGTNVVSTSTFTTGTTYLVKFEWNSADATGELFVCAYDPGSDNPFDSCTTSEGTCDGNHTLMGDPDGWLTENSAIIIDDVFVSDYDLSPAP